MNLEEIMIELETLFMQERYSDIEEFLNANIVRARNKDLKDVELSLDNELIGFYRETGSYEKALQICSRVINLMQEMEIEGTISYATTLLNVANAYRAAGLLPQALNYYKQVITIYTHNLPKDDMLFASYYNNISLLYQEMGEYEIAKDNQENALRIVAKKADKQFETAVTQANLANTCIELGLDEEAKARAEEAIRIFEEIGIEDAHYSAALSALGSIYYVEKNYNEALKIMEKSRNCVARYLGTDNIQYQRLSENIDIIQKNIEKDTQLDIEINTDEDIDKENTVKSDNNELIENTLNSDSFATEKEENNERKIPAAMAADGETKDTVSKIDVLAEYMNAMDNMNGALSEYLNEVENINDDDIISEEMEFDGQYENTNAVDVELEDTVNAEKTGIEKVVEETNAEETDAEETMIKETAIEDVLAETVLIEKDYDENSINAESEDAENLDKENLNKGNLNTVSEDADNTDSIDIEVSVAESQVEQENKKDNQQYISGLELSRLYYEEYGKPMIKEKFTLYENDIAVGLVGKGSDCFGYDDAISKDHDFGPGFVMWVTREVYALIGENLQKEYDLLPKTFMGVKRINTFHGKDRVGVKIIEDFYRELLGYDLLGELENNSGKENINTIKMWIAIKEYSLAASVNGKIFKDDKGIFTKYREVLNGYYPKPVWYRKIAQACAEFAQNGQYNLPRMQKRGQLVSAELAKAECVRQAMRLYYLLNRKYAPHDKWLYKGMPDNTEMIVSSTQVQSEVLLKLIKKNNLENISVKDLVNQIALTPVTKEYEEELLTQIEMLAAIFANELERQLIVGTANVYLDANTTEIMAKGDALLTAIVANAPINTALSLSIAKTEFEAFDKVQNEGGRASCQNNWPTFKIMRMSQYMTWNEEMLLQYLYEFKDNMSKGRNQIEEKYARMMESTAPDKYDEFKAKLPELSDEKKAIIEEIVKVQVKWMEEFAINYPRLADNARYIHTNEDSIFDTSYETYLRGELSTYSDKLLEMYGRYIVNYAREGRNVTKEIMQNTVRFYGYNSLEAANEKGV